MGALAVPLMIAGTAVTFMSQMQAASAAEEQGAAQQEILNRQADNARTVAQRNAQIRQDEANYAAARDREEAGQVQASSQREFIERKRKGRLDSSAAQARIAASGGGSLDPTSIRLLAGIENEGDYNANVSLYEGDSASSLLRSGASLIEFEGARDADMIRYSGDQNASLMNYEGSLARSEAKSKASSMRANAFGEALSSGGSIASKYAPRKQTIKWNKGEPSTYWGTS